MSYCVNCGVELKASEKKCPLCDTEVINPKKPICDSLEKNPTKIDTIPVIGRRYIATVISIVLLIPVFVTLTCNLVANATVSWSLYVIGAALLTFVFVLLPLYFKKYHLFTFMALDYIALFLFLAMINWLTKSSWIVSIALPLCICAYGFTTLFVTVIRKKSATSLVAKFAIFTMSIGILSVMVELILNMNLGINMINWSVYVLIPCAVLTIAFVLLDSRRDLKNEIRKRMFLK